MKRIYETVVEEHLQRYKQMLILAGPRQVGKTTVSLSAEKYTDAFTYLNWDNQDHRKIILEGPSAVANFIGLARLSASHPIVVFDELHKYRQWKTFLKGFFDTYQNNLKIIVTGSSKLDIYRTGGDSMMGRYFPYRIHPFSVAECLRTKVNFLEIQPPTKIKKEIFYALLKFGGFPEPFLMQDEKFSFRWQQLRGEQLFRGDIRDVSRIQEIDQLEILAKLLKHQCGELVNYSNLANKVRVSVDTIRRWIKILNAFYYCFIIKPWTKNVSRSLLKEPKIYLWDWSEADDVGQRAENFVAAHLLKAVHFWTDQGLGKYDLFFLRDKDKREVDFIVTKNDKAWFIVEVKNGDGSSINRHLEVFQAQTNAKHAFQVVINMDYIDKDCFSYHHPVIVPAMTFLSQLV